MPDSTIFSFDVATAKARNAYYFSTREGYDVLRSYVDEQPVRRLHVGAGAAGRSGMGDDEPDVELRRSAAVPAGHRSREAADAGSVVRLVRVRHREPVHGRAGADRAAAIGSIRNQSGIVWFPGSAPLYKGGRAGRRHRRQRRRRGAGRLRDGGRRWPGSSRPPSCASIAASSAPAKATTCGCRTRKFPRNPELTMNRASRPSDAVWPFV